MQAKTQQAPECRPSETWTFDLTADITLNIYRCHRIASLLVIDCFAQNEWLMTSNLESLQWKQMNSKIEGKIG